MTEQQSYAGELVVLRSEEMGRVSGLLRGRPIIGATRSDVEMSDGTMTVSLEGWTGDPPRVGQRVVMTFTVEETK